MTSQCQLTSSPNGAYLVAQVHQFISMVDTRTGASIELPQPIFTPLTGSGEADADGDESEAEENAEGGEGGQGEGEEEEEEKSAAQPKKKVKIASDQSVTSKGGVGQRSHEGPKPIRVMEFHTNQEWFMYQSEDKYIHLYHIHAAYKPTGFKHIITIGIPRKVQAAIFHPSATSPSTTHTQPESSTPLQLPHLLVADKTGDIFLISGPDLNSHKVELGHLANMTGLAFSSHTQTNGKTKYHFLSSDSDGKIRVSNVPNYFDIQSFCLGHEAFVSTFNVLPNGSTPFIISGGLTPEVIVWQLEDGAPIQRLNLAEHKPSSSTTSSSTSSTSSTEKPSDSYVSQVQRFSGPDQSHLSILVTVYPWPYVFLLAFEPQTKQLRVTSVLTLPSTPMHTQIISNHQLLFIDDTLKVRGWNLETNQELTDELDQRILHSLNTPLSEAQLGHKDLLITPSNASSFVGGGVSTGKGQPATPANIASALASGNQGRYISPFSSADHLMRLSLLSSSGFTFRRYADKKVREAYIQQKRAESNARREQGKLEKKKKKEENQRKSKEERAAANTNTMEE